MGRRCNHRTLGRRPICEIDGQSWLEAAHALSSGSAGYTYWVDPNHPDASLNNDGRDIDYPLPTAASALAKCRAFRNDQVAVAMNSFWTYGNVGVGRALPIRESVIVTVPGVRIVGLSPSSSLGVPWVPTADGETLITVRAMDVTVEGFNFWDDIYNNNIAVAAEWDGPPYGENLTVRRCYFNSLDYGVTLDYSWNCLIEDCRFDDILADAIYNPSVYGDPDYLTVRRCVFVDCAGGLNLLDCQYHLIADCDFIDCSVAIDMRAGTDHTIRNCTLNGAPAGVNNYVNLTGASDCLVAECMFACTVAQYDTTCSDATSGSWVDNHCTDGSPVAPPT